MKTIRAVVDYFGRSELRFGYDKELIEFVKSVTGFRYDKPRRTWWGPIHSLAALDFAGRARGDVQLAVEWPRQAPAVVVTGSRELRPYQTEAAARLINTPSFLLAWSMRVGKTSTAIVAGGSMLACNAITRVFVFAPANTMYGWEKELRSIYPNMPAATMDGVKNVVANTPRSVSKDEKEFRGLLKQESALRGASFVFCQHDLIARRSADLLALASAGLFAVACDEPQSFVDFKAPRSTTLMDMAQHKNALRRWGLSGTPMRNASKDLPVAFEFLGCPPPNDSDTKRSPWPFLIRYADAKEETIGDKTIMKVSNVETNGQELQARLWSIGHRLTREEVAPWLPKADRTVVLANLTKDASARYRALESRIGAKAMAAVNGSERLDHLRALAASIIGPKIEEVVERLKYHADERGVKVTCGMLFHESLNQLGQRLFPVDTKTGVVKPVLSAPVFLSAGWDSPEKRVEATEAWRNHSGPAVLLCTILSNSTGIDHADAEVQVNGELPWVPSDALQWEARLQDVHQGKRTSPPLHEYILARGTIDEDMALAMLRKMGAISRIVGSEREMVGLDGALRDSGLVNTVDLGLTDRSDTAVDAALNGLRRRLMGETNVAGAESDNVALASAVAEAFDDEPAEEAT